MRGHDIQTKDLELGDKLTVHQDQGDGFSSNDADRPKLLLLFLFSPHE